MWQSIAVLLLRLSVKLYPMLEAWLEGMLKAPPPPDMDPVLHSTVVQMLPVSSESAAAAVRISKMLEEEKLKANGEADKTQ